VRPTSVALMDTKLVKFIACRAPLLLMVMPSLPAVMLDRLEKLMVCSRELSPMTIPSPPAVTFTRLLDLCQLFPMQMSHVIVLDNQNIITWGNQT
jgi:hypothetical protein